MNSPGKSCSPGDVAQAKDREKRGRQWNGDQEMGVTGEVGGSGSGTTEKKTKGGAWCSAAFAEATRRYPRMCVKSGSLIFAGHSSAAAAAATRRRAKRTRVSEGKRENGAGEGPAEGGVEWLEQLLVKDLSQPITSVPIVSAETGEGVTQTCLRLPTTVRLSTLRVRACVRVLFLRVRCEGH